MRYYNQEIIITTEEIEKNTTIRLRDYDYDSTIGAVNSYMYKANDNHMGFFIYRILSDRLLAVISYDEQKVSGDVAFSSIYSNLYSGFEIVKFGKAEEITIHEALDNVVEARRKGFLAGAPFRYVEDAKLWLYEIKKVGDQLPYDFSEIRIKENKKDDCSLYNKRFVKELNRIDKHSSYEMSQRNLFHYVLSVRSDEAADEMIETLCRHLYNASSLTSRRIEIIRSMPKSLYLKNNHLIEMIENNLGGVVVFDLTQKLGDGPEEYQENCDFLMQLVKEYHKDCLFIFTYNINDPGYSYMLLPDLSDRVRLINLSEGKGSKKKATNYMKNLVKASDNAGYLDLVDEYMDAMPNKDYTQTEVLKAFGDFDSWAVNKNMLEECDYDFSEEFVLDREDSEESGVMSLDEMIGLKSVKEQIDEILAEFYVAKERKTYRFDAAEQSCLHMVFAGDPGTGKTEVARAIGRIARDKGILKSGAVVEIGGNNVTPLSLKKYFALARGGILFIDEAYSIYPTFVTALIREMENHRDEVIVILAGYYDSMKSFMNTNEGLKSRIPYWIDFPNYNADDLTKIFKLMLKKKGFNASPAALKKAHLIFEKQASIDDFGNGRYVRNFMERAIKKQSNRIYKSRSDAGYSKRQLFSLTAEDITEEQNKRNITAKDEKDAKKEKRNPGTAKKELNDMIGLKEVKSLIEKAVAQSKLNALYVEHNIKSARPSMHMVFTGNPGTAKTTVARKYAEILRDEKVLANGNFVEVDRGDLVGQYVGQTAPLVKKRFKEAQGGVLFIDEAYSLCDDRAHSYGDEAIDAIVKEMEDNRENTVVIFAGYPEPMKEFLKRNPGLSSRIAFNIEFEDYNIDELCDITKLILKQNELKITPKAMDKLRANYEKAMKTEGYGNGRYVRKMLEEAQMNLALRISKKEHSDITKKDLITLRSTDIPEYKESDEGTQSTIGFVA